MNTLEEDAQSAKEWMDRTGIPIVYPTETREELDMLWRRWLKLSAEDMEKSNEKSIEIFGMDNASHYDILGLLYV